MFMLRVKQVIYETDITTTQKGQSQKKARILKNLFILSENSAEDLRLMRALLMLHIYENAPNLVVQGRTQLEYSSHIVKFGVKATC